jgi:hypothetical protein
MVRIHLPPAVSQANFRIAPLARPDLVERQPELLAHHLTAAGDIEHALTQWLKAGCEPATNRDPVGFPATPLMRWSESPNGGVPM